MTRPPRRSFVPRLETLEDRTTPSTLTVVNNLDSGPGSVRAALASASNGDTITFAPSLAGKTITLTSGALTADVNVTITGPGAAKLAISGHDHGAILDVAAGATVSASGLTFTHGLAATGGAIDNHGILTLRNDTFSANWAYQGTGGGAIFNETGAHLTVNHVTFNANRATAASGMDVFGGALLNEGSALVSSSTFLNNQAVGGGTSDFFGGSVGGAIANTDGGNLVVTGSTFTGNQAISAAGPYAASGGAIDNDAGLTQMQPSTAYISDSTFTHNQAIGNPGALASGGALANQGNGTTMMVNNVTLTNNRALGGGGGDGSVNTGGGMGGGIMNVFGASITIDDSTFTGNQAVGGNHNTPAAGVPGALAGAGQGGGLLNSGATATVIDSTFTSNKAEGGTNDMGPGSAAAGGAIENFGTGVADSSSSLTVINSTLTNNAAVAGHGGPIAPAPAQPPVIASNFAAGGAIDTSDGGQSSVLDSTFRSNQAVGGAAGSTQTGGQAVGGAISVGFTGLLGMPDGSTLTLTDSTLTGNAAIGGLGGAPAATAVFNPVAVNLPSGAGYSLVPAGQGGEGDGGALGVLDGASANVVGSTIQNNTTRGGAGGGYGGSAGSGFGGGVYMQFSSDAVTWDTDTVIAGNHASAIANNDTFVFDLPGIAIDPPPTGV